MIERLLPGPVRDRLEWILDGLDGRPGWGSDAAEVIAPPFLEAIPAETFRERFRQRSQKYAPLQVVGIDLDETSGQVRFRDRDGQLRVVHCSIEAEPPHRITTTWMSSWVPEFTTPPLPQDFAGSDLPHADQQLIVLSGVPGTGKSSLAEAIGRERGIPVFAVDWLLGALTPFGGRHSPELMGSGYELLTTLAYRQLQLGQSVILDAPAEEPEVRDRWRSLAVAAGARLAVITCVCSDLRVHEERLQGRSRGIPGWHEGGDWKNVQQRLATFRPWEESGLTVDAVRPVEANLAAALEFAASSSRRA
ncbi:MAG TPA: ATP-binding protein [Mycobacteriales bacterium]|nr:ATP-binding protein [Mycobacteriales bacterium]